MPKAPLKEPYATLENEAIRSMLAGFKRWRPDLDFPESYSDMEACFRGLIQMFEVTRRDLPLDIKEITEP